MLCDRYSINFQNMFLTPKENPNPLSSDSSFSPLPYSLKKSY